MIIPSTALGLNLLIGLDRSERNATISKLIADHPMRTTIFSQRNEWEIDEWTLIQPLTTQNISSLLDNQRQLVDKYGLTPDTKLRVILDNTFALSMLYASNGQLQMLIHASPKLNITVLISRPTIPLFHRYLRRSYILPSVAKSNYTLLASGIFEGQDKYLACSRGNLLILDYPDDGPGYYCTIPLNQVLHHSSF